MKFQEILRDEDIKKRWDKVRRYFFLKESTYDTTSRCNLRCDGCYYFQGDKQFTTDTKVISKWKALFEAEKARGINYVVLAGAEPSLVPQICQVAYGTIPLGCIATNGLKKISPDIGYKIHISVWGNDRTSKLVRKQECLQRQLDHYAGDERAVFIYTFTRKNVDEVIEVADTIIKAGGKISFNQFSAPVGYQGELHLDAHSRKKMASVMTSLLRRHPASVLYSDYNIEIHSSEKSLHEQFGCPYPRQNPFAVVGLGKTFRQYRTDLSWDKSAACCVPDTDCRDCRHYAAGSAIVTSKLVQHANDPELFRKWLDYVDNYLGIWVHGHQKDAPLYQGRSQELMWRKNAVAFTNAQT